MKNRHRPLMALAAGVLVTAAALLGVSRSSGELAQAAALAVPTNTAPPTISGTPQRGATLTATRGEWANDDGQTQYQWQRCATQAESSCVDIPGETTNQRILVADDVGDYLRVRTRAHNADGWSPFVSSVMTPQIAEASAPAATKLPSISGTARDGETLTADRGEWTNSPTSYTQQWQRCDADGSDCANIAGETSLNRLLTASDVGKRLRIVVTATNAGGSSSAISALSAVVAAKSSAPVNTQAPAISGTPQAGQTLTASNGSWSNSPTAFGYQWQRCDANGNNCANIAGETRNTRVVAPDDVGSRLRVLVTATNAAGSTTAASAPTAPITTGLPPGAIRLSNGLISVPVSSVSLPERLIIDRVRFSPNPVRSRVGAITGRFRVVDTRGYVVRDALVFVRTTPLVTSTPPEGRTGQDGFVTMTFFPRATFPLRNGYSVQFFLRARKPGENVLAGVSTRRLVQVRTARPR